MKEKLKPSKRKRRKDRKKMRLEKEVEANNQCKVNEESSNTEINSESVTQINENEKENIIDENSKTETNELTVDKKEISNDNENNINEKNTEEKENNDNNINNDTNNKSNTKEENNSEVEQKEDKPEVIESLIIYENQEMLDQVTVQENDTPETSSNSTTLNTNQVLVKNFKTYHSAYFDAFMTGYVFCCQCIECEEDILNSDHVNKLYVIGKSMPLLIRSSPFTKNSEHCLKILETI